MELSEDARRARREYKRRWNRENPDKVTKHQQTYWEKKGREQQAETLQEEVKE